MASVIFAGMSGSATSDAAGLATNELEAMLDAGYDKEFAVAITAASSLIGPIIPLQSLWSSTECLLGFCWSTLWGIIPGLLMAATLMVMVALYAMWRNYLIQGKRPTLGEIWRQSSRCLSSPYNPGDCHPRRHLAEDGLPLQRASCCGTVGLCHVPGDPFFTTA